MSEMFLRVPVGRVRQTCQDCGGRIRLQRRYFRPTHADLQIEPNLRPMTVQEWRCERCGRGEIAEPSV